MFKNYLKVAFRSLNKNRTYAVINILGLALGLTVTILVFLFVKNETSYDKNWKGSERIYRIGLNVNMMGQKMDGPASPSPMANAFRTEFTDVETATRIYPRMNESLMRSGETNIYIKNTGKGVYGGISYYMFDATANNIDTDFDDGTYGPGETNVKFNTVNLKVGAKLGKAFYFRIELGYGFGKIPETIVITRADGNSSTTEDIGDVFSYIGNSGVPLFNIGIGYSFL